MKTVVLVLQMGKVGSWSIVKAIQAARPDLPLSTLDRVGEAGSCIVHTHAALDVFDWLATVDPAKVNAIVVSAVRDPLRNSISAFFQNFDDADRIGTDVDYSYVGSRETILRMPAEDLVEHFHLKVVPRAGERFEEFTELFGKVVERNAFSLPFEARGVARGQFSRGSFAVLRLHRFSDALPALGPLLRATIVGAQREHLSADKWYADKYREFLRKLRPTPGELDAFYGSRFARGSFTAEELASFRARWATPPDVALVAAFRSDRWSSVRAQAGCRQLSGALV